MYHASVPAPDNAARLAVAEWLDASSAPLRAAVGTRDVDALVAAVAAVLVDGDVFVALADVMRERDALAVELAAAQATIPLERKQLRRAAWQLAEEHARTAGTVDGLAAALDPQA